MATISCLYAKINSKLHHQRRPLRSLGVNLSIYNEVNVCLNQHNVELMIRVLKFDSLKFEIMY